jgi:CheY-like chemotaxis protein
MLNILLAEDDRNFGRVLKSELEDDGYAVDLVGDGVEAVLNFIERDNAYDFLLMDIKMPKLDGINALRIIKRLNRDVPAITISGNAGSGEMAESVRAGAIRCLTKPFEISQLKDEIKKYSTRHCGV